MKLFQWRGRRTAKSFGDQWAPLLREAFPDADIERADDLGFRLSFPQANAGQLSGMLISLDNAYQEFLANPADFDEIAARHISGAKATLAPDEPLDPARIVPAIKTRQWLDGVSADATLDPAEEFCCEPLTESLFVVYAEHREGFKFLRRKVVSDAGFDVAELATRARENLRGQTTGFEWIGSGAVRVASAGGNVESSLILRPDLFAPLGLAAGATPIVSVPDRSSLLAVLDHDVFAVCNLTMNTLSLCRSEPVSISNRLYHWNDGSLREVDSGADDASHPIPNLSLLDITAKKKDGGSLLVLVMASPLDASPRSVCRLARKLDGYLQHLKSTDHQREFGKATPDNTEIRIDLHPGSAPEIKDLLQALGAWVEARGARLEVQAPT